jgi:MoaA/NifB/PqqE/SkfB family radical SAM enzyme
MLTSVKVLHLEPTTDCNAECPQCQRTYGTFTSAELSLERVKELFSQEFIQQLDKMYMCGNLGDPAAARDTIDIFRYFREVNPKITLGMNTNGGIRSKQWWSDLGKILNRTQDYVIFSIDGLEDTNHIYRRKVLWNRVMENAASFIANGGLAHWDMLVFGHNEHQVDQAQTLAKELGFRWFRAKVSKRHASHPVEWLQIPKNWQDPIVKQGPIDCQAIKDSSVYVNAQGQFYPCCWLGSTNYTLDQFNQIIDSWTKDNRNLTCVKNCSKDMQGTSFTNQWQREVEFQFTQ